ncbi:MAG: hypothetical protein JSS81_03910 [Acidobacteria bacterium]|nr:hypothetical protein [Acidobacteriota bacterium]
MALIMLIKVIEKNHSIYFSGLIVFLILIINSFFISNSHSQILTEKEKNPQMPSIFLSYDSQAKRDSRCLGEGGDQVILQLHNNTDNYINVNANWDVTLSPNILDETAFKLPDGTNAKTLKSGSDVELCYEVEGVFNRRSDKRSKKFTPPKREVPACGCSYISDLKQIPYPERVGYWIKPKEFIKFGVPLKFLGKNMKIYTEFNYLWEFENGELRYNEPRHRVYFYYSDMPDYVP